MIDIHHHLIFGVDDGATDLETSVRMVEMAANDGITHIACTPHAISRFPYQFEVNAERRAMIQERVGDRVILGAGCDFHLSFDNIEDALTNPKKYTINGKNYLLVEFDDFHISQNISDTFYELTLAGARPILTHPERNLLLQKEPERIEAWLEQGCLIQITSNSLTGRFGKTAQSMGFRLLDKGWVHFLATDAHNTESRPPVMSEARRLVAERYGAELAERLCVTNPLAVFEGRPVPKAPRPRYDEADDKPGPKHGGFFSRLFGRR
jgi:protein-tyrosine phosphatase